MGKLTAIAGDRDFDQPLRLLERTLNVHITVHDLTGVFLRRGKRLLPRDRHAHQHRICRIPNPGHEPCLDHCYNAVHRELVATNGPGCHHCWRGLCEIAVPLIVSGCHVATCFAGPWRSGQVPPASLQRKYHQHWLHLPPFPSGEEEQIAALLELVVRGLLAHCDDQPDDDEGPRRQLIEAWLQAHAHEPVRLLDLAEAMHLSASRCGHVVGEVFGTTFPALLRERRLQRARSMLAETALPVRAIAERVGMPAEAHFHRVFKQATGFTPRDWRRACHANRGRRWPREQPTKAR